jgi:hypothetical protein
MKMKRLDLSFLRLVVICGFLWSGAARAEIQIVTDGDLNVASVTDIPNLEFITPNSPEVAVNPARMKTHVQEVCKDGGFGVLPDGACTALKTALENHQPIMPAALKVSLMLTPAIPLNEPLYTIEEWFTMYKNNRQLINLTINGNWFNINWQTLPDKTTLGFGYSYKMPVTTTVGYDVSNGQIISAANTKDPTNQCLFDALAVTGQSGQYAVQIVKNDQINNLPSPVHAAVSGILIVDNGVYFRHSPFSPQGKCNNTDKKIARIGVGLTADGKILIVMVKQPGRGVDGWTEQEFANEMINHKAAKAINLDNSGSSQFLYTKDGQSFTESKMGDKLPVNIGDQPVNTPVYRPVPNFVGIIPT